MRLLLLILFCGWQLHAYDPSLSLRCGPYPQPRTVVQCINRYLLKTGEPGQPIERVLVHEPTFRQGFYGWRVTFFLKNELPQREILINRTEGISFQFTN